MYRGDTSSDPTRKVSSRQIPTKPACLEPAGAAAVAATDTALATTEVRRMVFAMSRRTTLGSGLDPSARDVVDYALAKRAALFDLAAGRTGPIDVCDAQTYLLRAARYHGEPLDRPCPVCQRDGLTAVTYTFGDCFRADANGRARRTADVAALARELPEFSVYVVEVCLDCRWNHLVTSYVLGTGEPARRRARS
jgi:uncharacterized ParB-like nuclease family protein